METDSLHLHDFYEIIWFQEGDGVHYVDFSEYPVTSGSIFFISPGQIHSFDSRHDQKGVLLKVCTGIFDDFVNLPCVTIRESDGEALGRIVEAIGEELRNAGGIGNKEALQALVKLFIIKVRRSHAGTDARALNPVKPSHKAFLAFRKLIEENYCSMHTVKEYAALLNVTPKTLTLYVNECSPYSPLELINNRIILEAKRLLRFSLLSVKEIAFRLGFDDPSYFVKFFKRLVRQSPADYRETS
ncbi:MAG: helix-turn-helix domain-containing protein [Candidatus Cryptobacteroides sp.]